MNRTLVRLLAAGSFSLVLTAGPAVPQTPTPQPPAPADLTKRKTEAPAERLVAGAATPAPGAEPFVNPPVPPGKVRWHPDFVTACRAAARSGKPVLLFQMMGNLDNRFC